MNTDYLVKKGTAIEVKDYKHIYREINRLLGSEGVLDRMRNNIEKLVKPDSALDIAKLAVSAEE
jgi:UDP-N-acetylglucosamine:LPS N-acetylglucosamine transferase